MNQSSDHPASLPGVTVAIPVYNEEQILVANTIRLLRYLKTLDCPYQVVIGSNGSTDRTVARGEALHRHVKEVDFFHLGPRGVGRAFRECVDRARFPLLVSFDMDLSADIRFLEQAIRLAQHHDIVVGSKRLGQQRRSYFRRLGSDTFLWCTRRLMDLPYDDYSIAAKAYRVSFLRQHASLIGAGSSYVLDLCHRARRDGRSIACVPVACEDLRVSKFNLWNEAVYKFQRLFTLWCQTSVEKLVASNRSARSVGRAAVVNEPR